MQGIRLQLVVGAALLCATGPAFSWSLLNEVRVLDPSVVVQMDFEMPAAKSYCESLPENLDRLECELSQIEDFWFGVDGAGNRYGVVSAADANGTWFDIMRRPPGSQSNEPVLRVTKRVEIIFGKPIKLQITGRWTVDPANGEMTLTFRGQCLTTLCASQNDDEEHMGTIRVTGLPGLFEIAASYIPPGTVSFLLPAVPEGLPTGSRLDIYAGPLGTLPDLGLAQLLLCNAAAGLKPGDLVNITDPLGDPASGEGRYYLAAVVSGAERRVGRRMLGGMLVGRDPSGLPICSGS